MFVLTESILRKSQVKTRISQNDLPIFQYVTISLSPPMAAVHLATSNLVKYLVNNITDFGMDDDNLPIFQQGL